MWSTILFWISTSLYIVLIASTVCVVLLENRQPEKTIAWVIAIILLPVVGFIIFFFFGQSMKHTRFITRHRYHRLTRRMLSRDLADTAPPVDPPAKYLPLIRMNEKRFGAMRAEGNEVIFLDSGAKFVASLLREMERAESHIHIETYIIEDDPVGRLISDALIAHARRGVEVRLLYDDVGCWNVPKRFFERLKEAGVDARPFMPVRFPALTHKINYRNHRKISIIDGRVGYIGGMNFARRYVSCRERRWRDLQLMLRGNAVGRLQLIFMADWQFVTTEALDEKRFFATPQIVQGQKGALLQFVSSNPVTPLPELGYALTWAIAHAERYLYVQTPYFMPTEPVLQALKTAALSGVNVRIMLPRKPDGRILRYANDSYVAELLGAGIRVFFYEGGFLHAKCLVADDDWCSVGSANMDFRSLSNNFESNALIYNSECAKAVRTLFEADLEEAHEVRQWTWKKRSLGRKLLESLTRIMSPLC